VRSGRKREEVEAVIARTANFFGVEPAEVLGKARHRTVAHARHVAMYIAHTAIRPRPSLHELGAVFHRHHTAVLAAVRKVHHSRTYGEPEDATLITAILVAVLLELSNRRACIAALPSLPLTSTS
jgi:chromosomal replication initiation ATPase DnaA